MYEIGIYHGGFGECPPHYVEPHIKWCGDNICGFWKYKSPHERKIRYGREVILNYTFIFEDQDDAMAFKLRWL